MTTSPIVESAPAEPTAWQGRWAGEADTQAFAQRLAACPALGHATLALHGDLGAGKTTLVRHLLRALGVSGRIKSPTYAVVEPHEGAPAAGEGAPLPIWLVHRPGLRSAPVKLSRHFFWTDFTLSMSSTGS